MCLPSASSASGLAFVHVREKGKLQSSKMSLTREGRLKAWTLARRLSLRPDTLAIVVGEEQVTVDVVDKEGYFDCILRDGEEVVVEGDPASLDQSHGPSPSVSRPAPSIGAQLMMQILIMMTCGHSLAL